MDAQFIWDLEDDPDGNVQHIAEHGLTIEEVESAVTDPGAGRTRADRVAAQSPSGRRTPVDPSRSFGSMWTTTR
jgi:hypothetical protein